MTKLGWPGRLANASVFLLTSDQMLNSMITSKHIGHALTRFELNVYYFEERQLSFTALAQHCPNIEHVYIE